MHNNGVSHKVEKNDVSGIRRILTWLSYIPKSRKAGIPIHLQVHDPVDRLVTYSPRRNQPYDPRWLLNGCPLDDGTFETGLLDENSFDEIMSAW
jgi:acetyl-CoA carboxylase/biotin carboxylase 1